MDGKDIYYGTGLLFIAILVLASRGCRVITAAVLLLGWANWAARLRGRDETTRIFQAVLAVWCALAWVLNAGIIPVIRRTLASVALLVLVSTAILLAANNEPWHFVELVMDLSAAAFVALHLQINGPTWCGIEFFILLSAATLAAADDIVEHLTWWSLLTLAVFDGTVAYDALVDGENLAPLFTPILRVLSWTVAAGVVMMSAMGCSLLKTALRDNKVVPYVFGNFAMHYYPALRATFAKCKHVSNGTRAVAFVAVYSLLHDAPAVYGCTFIEKEMTPIALVSVAVLVNALQYV